MKLFATKAFRFGPTGSLQLNELEFPQTARPKKHQLFMFTPFPKIATELQKAQRAGPACTRSRLHVRPSVHQRSGPVVFVSTTQEEPPAQENKTATTNQPTNQPTTQASKHASKQASTYNQQHTYSKTKQTRKIIKQQDHNPHIVQQDLPSQIMQA